MSDVASWSESDSETYRALAAVAVPRRREQFATLLSLVPFADDAKFRIVELACGEGLLAQALLTVFSKASYLGLDGSASMREATASRLADKASRATVAVFELGAPDWLPLAESADLIVSSLCIHHLDGPGKRQLFKNLAERMSDCGVLLIADLVAPQQPGTLAHYAQAYDHAVFEQAAILGEPGKRAKALIERERWNYFRYPESVDQPSFLADQLVWLREAGFVSVDCAWLYAGHAIYGGAKGGELAPMSERYERAREIAAQILA